MITINENGMLGRYLYHGTLANGCAPEVTDICAVTRTLLKRLICDFLVCGIAVISLVGILMAPLSLVFGWLADAFVFYVGVGYAVYFAGILLSAMFVWEKYKPSQKIRHSKAASVAAELYQGWKNKYCPVVRIVSE